jgi:ABC-2 type transport system permease protein
MREAWLIAKREYLEHVRSKTFRISTVLIPVLFALFIGIGNFSGKISSGTRHIVVASNDAALAASVRTEMMTTHASDNDGKRSEAQRIRHMHLDVQAPVSTADLESLNQQVENKSIDGYLWLNVQPGKTLPEATYVSRSAADFLGNARMEDAIGRAVAQEALVKQGMSSDSAQQLMTDVDLKTRQVKNGQVISSDANKGFWGAYVMAFVLYFTIVFYGMNVARSVVAEKTSRVFEVLLASARPESLMAGKLLGVGAAGLTQMGVWIVALLVLSGPAFGASIGKGGLAAYGVTPLQLGFFVIYFLLGYFFYSALSAALGSTVGQESEIQQFAMILILPLLVGLVLIAYIMSNPSAWPVVLLSLIPFCTPIVMCERMAAMTVPWWQLALSLVLMVASTYGLLWVASRIYRVGILMYGKRPTLPELMRWLRYS